MRNMVFRLALFAGVVVVLGACADSPTQSGQRRTADAAAPAQNAQVAPQGCIADGLCPLPPISGGWCEPWMELDWDCDDGGGECLSSAGPADLADGSVESCPGGGDSGGGLGGGGGGGDGDGDPGTCIESVASPCEPEPECELDCPADGEEEVNTDICPQPLRGKVVTALVPVAGRNHEFKFEGTMRRLDPAVGRSPAWYQISGPTLSKDNWWLAADGNILLVCWGRWTFRNSLWIGTVYVQSTDLHLVMSAGHPDF